ncbi:MAG: serine hydrolase [Bacteroidetes bacterium]|nr:serine hydrolase [Bacteroidota bacterium]
MKYFFSTLKWIFFIAVFFVVHAYLTGNSHIFKTLKNTVLKGRLGPSVDTKNVFNTRKVNIGKPQPWIEDSMFGKLTLSPNERKEIEKYQTLSFLVVKNNKIIYEEYWQGYSSSSNTNSWSMAKSILSILTGAAIKEDKIKSVEQNVSDFLPEYNGTGLKIKHLLTMSSGINFKEQYKNPYGYTAKALYGNDLVKLNKKYKVNNIPGKYFSYLSGNSQLLSFVLQKATGKTVSQYASEKLWKKIGAEHPAYWSLDHKGGNEKGFCCFHSNARDFAKIGQLMLQHGIWGNDTILPTQYYNQSIALAPTMQLDGKPNDLYGYQWWIIKYKGLDIFYARGIDGQYIIDIPSKNMVVVRLGRKRNDTKKNGHPLDFYIYTDAALSIVN